VVAEAEVCWWEGVVGGATWEEIDVAEALGAGAPRERGLYSVVRAAARA
jgi:hypothetical protein